MAASRKPGIDVGMKTTLDSVIDAAAGHLLSAQATAGCWPARFDTGVMADAQTLIGLALLGVSDQAWTDPLLKRLVAKQRTDGSWGVHPEDDGDLSTTVECYYAVTLYDKWPNPMQEEQARTFILSRGGVKQCRNLTKTFLAIGGEIPWSWLPSPRLYSWLFAANPAVTIRDIVMFTRVHIAPMLVLSATRYVAAEQAPQLPMELTGDWRRARRTRGLSLPTLRRLFRCLIWMLEEREADGSAAGYHSSSLLLLFIFRALGFDLHHPHVCSLLRGMRRNLDMEPATGIGHQQTCNAHIWNTALSLQGLLSAGFTSEHEQLERAAAYLYKHQHDSATSLLRDNPACPGGWGFSDNNTKHPDNDDTVACLEALYPFRHHFPDDWWRGVDWLLGMQNQDGGWAAFEKDCQKRWLEWIPANDMHRSMTDPSTPDITGRVIEFLLQREILTRAHPQIRRATKWLCRNQEVNGSWFGRWGTTYIYGTWCAVKALVSAGWSGGSHSLDRAKVWLLSIQHPDGSFGESCRSDVAGRFVDVEWGTASHTAWALDSLVHLAGAEAEESARLALLQAANRAARWLMEQMRETGTWTEELPTGSAFPGALHIRYDIYPKVWPLIALCHYRDAVAKALERR